jgi:hypothetical protein
MRVTVLRGEGRIVEVRKWKREGNRNERENGNANMDLEEWK